MDALLNSGFAENSLMLEVGQLPASGGLLTTLMDELACGIMVVTPEGYVLQANRAARAAVAHAGLIQASGLLWQTSSTEHSKLMQDALTKASVGTRCLLTLAGDAGKLTLVAVPLAVLVREPRRIALIFSRSSVHEPVMLAFFARSHGLTATEEQVLDILCQGYSAPEVATQMSVAVSTVRTHVRSMCAKTRSYGIRELVNRVAVLPPITEPLVADMGNGQIH